MSVSVKVLDPKATGFCMSCSGRVAVVFAAKRKGAEKPRDIALCKRCARRMAAQIRRFPWEFS